MYSSYTYIILFALSVFPLCVLLAVLSDCKVLLIPQVFHFLSQSCQVMTSAGCSHAAQWIHYLTFTYITCIQWFLVLSNFFCSEAVVIQAILIP